MFDIWTEYQVIVKQVCLYKITKVTICFNILYYVVFYSKCSKFDYFWTSKQ